MRRLRVLNILCIFACWAALICLRLVWLQLIQHHAWVDRAAKQQERTFEVAPRRGVLYDRNLHELAMTVYADSIYAVPIEIGADRAATAAALAKVVHTDPSDRFTSAQQMLARFNASKNFAWVARKLDPAVIEKVKALNLKGVYTQKEFKRFYPDQALASQVLGYVGLDDNGLGGVEQNFDEDLHGTPGRMLTAIDARRHVLGSEEREPLPGENLVLSIDTNIQFMAEKALDANMARTHAESGTVVVQDPHTGQILALAIRPTFNPNDFRHATTNLLRNHAVSDVYEPGSTFKLVTYSAALEEKVATPEGTVDCQGGQINVAGRIVHDAPGHHFGVITVAKALEESSDVGAIKLAQRMGVEHFYKYIHDFGFGERSGIELPGETRGLLKPPRRWQPTTIGSIPMGQEVGVTPIQLVTMASTIANGGMYLPPRVLLESTEQMKGSAQLRPATFHVGTDLPNPLPEGAHRVVSTLTAAQMRKMMEGVVLNGTGKVAQLNGYSAGGKTGTAEKIDPRTHTYSKTKFVASFVGFAPVNNPAITVAVIMDSPDHSMHYGAEASAPVFHDLAQQILEYLGVPHDQDLKSMKVAANDAKTKEADEMPSERIEDLNSLFAEVNNLPADDPLRSAMQTDAQAAPESKVAASQQVNGAAGQQVSGSASQPISSMTAMTQTIVPPVSSPPPLQAPKTIAQAQPPNMPLPATPVQNNKGPVVVDSSKRIAVPSFVGQDVRKVVEQAGSAGLGIQVLGSGIARNQAPAPGTMVPVGTEIVVRFGH